MGRSVYIGIPAWGHLAPAMKIATVYTEDRSALQCPTLCMGDLNNAVLSSGLRGMYALFIRHTEELTDVVLDCLKHTEVDHVYYDADCPWGYLVARKLGKPNTCILARHAIAEHGYMPVTTALKMAYREFRHSFPMREFRRLLGDRGVGDPFWSEHRNIVASTRMLYQDTSIFPAGTVFAGPVTAEPRGGAVGVGIYGSYGTIHMHDERAMRGLRKVAHVVADGASDQNGCLSVAKLFITHGGNNSINEAMFHGVPMVLVPQQIEQYAAAFAVQELGLGVIAKSGKAKHLLEAVARVRADHRMRARCERVAYALQGQAE